MMSGREWRWLLMALLVVVFLGVRCDQRPQPGTAVAEEPAHLAPVREEVEMIERGLLWKKKNVLPELMREAGVDMWIITEEDRDVFLFLVPAAKDGLVRYFPHFLVFFMEAGYPEPEERLIGNTEDPAEWGPLFPGSVFFYKESLETLGRLIRDKKPGRIAVGRGRTPELERTLGKYGSRLVSAELLSQRWIETRIPREIDAYKTVVDVTHRIIAEAFSNRVITPGVTTTGDVDWWVKQKLHDLGLGDVFGPTVMAWRSLEENKKSGDPARIFDITIPPYCGNNTVIRRGDMLSCDFGIRYLGLETDIQQVGYVLNEGESDVPAGLKKALSQGNRLQDILASEFRQLRTGNEILFAALGKAREEGLRAEIYCHPMGTYVYRYGLKGGVFPKGGVDAGPSIGAEGHFDGQGNQLPTQAGERVLHVNTAYAMELDVTSGVPEWQGQDVRIVLEEKVVYTKDGLIFPGGRQTEFHIIR